MAIRHTIHSGELLRPVYLTKAPPGLLYLWLQKSIEAPSAKIRGLLVLVKQKIEGMKEN
jgi:hypothetical protein